MTNSNLRRMLIATVSIAALGGCGANDIASPGTGGNISIINNPAPTPAPTPTPTPTVSLVTAATGCPTIADAQGLTDRGTITGPTGTYRVCELPVRIVRSINLTRIPGLLYYLPGRVDFGLDNGPTPATAGSPRTYTNVPASTPGAVLQPGGTYNVTATADISATLTIQPGVVIFANSGASWLNINRGNRISAVGTATAPIVFTSRDNVLGLNTDTSSGQWGGVVLSGRAQITDCAVPGAALPNGSSTNAGTAACERQTEGAVDPALYGGANNLDNSGRMSYVQIRYSGFVLSAATELQSLTTEGIGEGTVLDHIQSFNSSDDGAEFFGGHVAMKYYVSIGAEDDNLDTDTGTKANFQYVIVAQRAGSLAQGADAMIEADTDNNSVLDNPRQNTTVSNATFIDRTGPGNADQAAILLRGATDYTLVNTVMTTNPAHSCLRISDSRTAAATVDATIDENGAPVFRSVVMQCLTTRPFIGSPLSGQTLTDADVAAIFGSGTNNNNATTYTPTLTSLFINGANETAVTAFDQTTLNGRVFNGITITPAGFFDRTTYIGAVSGASDTWYQGWTCNSTTAALGTSLTGNCTTLPTI